MNDKLKKIVEVLIFICGVILAAGCVYLLYLGVCSSYKEARVVSWVIIGFITMAGFCQHMANRRGM